VLLVCNAPDAVATLLREWTPLLDAKRGARLQRLCSGSDWQRDEARYVAGQTAVSVILA
jgi:hypothetical protein